MADRRRPDKTRVGPDGEPTNGAPRWVKVFGFAAITLVLLFVILHLTRGGAGGHSRMEHGVQQP